MSKSSDKLKHKYVASHEGIISSPFIILLLEHRFEPN